MLSSILWFLLFLPLLLVSKTVKVGMEIVTLNTEKLKAEGFYSKMVKEENRLRYSLIRSTVYHDRNKKNPLLATLSRRQPAHSSVYFVQSEALDIADRRGR